MQIRVKVEDVSELDELKLQKIFKLSENRKKQYMLVEEGADVLITANPHYQIIGEKPVLTLGTAQKFPESKAHIKQPLLGIRVLKILDAIDLTPFPDDPVEIVPKAIEKPVIEVTPAFSIDLDESSKTYDILVVDDSTLIHRALEMELQQAEFESNISFVESGEQCLDSIKNEKFDLIFLDVMMPGIDGFETCTEIRKNPVYKKTPIIMLSAKTSPLDEVKGVMAGCTTYLSKPIKHDDFQKLLVRMDKWLENFNTPRLSQPVE